MAAKKKKSLLPNKMRINSQHWDIKYVGRADLIDGRDVLAGCEIAQERTIMIDRDLCSEAAKETLIHEVIHAYFELEREFEVDAEEELVRMFTRWFLDLTRNNNAFWT